MKKGANPNAENPFYLDFPEYENQPYTPLRLVVFCLSNNLLETKDLEYLSTITDLLLAHGANAKKAIELAEKRYGKFNPSLDDPFNRVLSKIYNHPKE